MRRFPATLKTLPAKLAALAALMLACGLPAAPAKPADVIRKALAAAKPGAIIEVPNGSYDSPGVIKITAKGAARRPITLRAAAPGGVTFTGDAQFVVEGDHIVISGFRFTNGKPARNSGVFDLRGNHNRVTDCAIIDYNAGADPNAKKSTFWVAVRGRHNRVDHCLFQGKTSAGVLLFVQRPTSAPNHAQIDNNVFRDIPEGKGNGFETIRIGTSDESQSDSHSAIFENYFENCDGEIEIISVKSGKNTIRQNTFVNCRGSLTLRHGAGNTASGNLFLVTGDARGARKGECAGIRVSDSGHVIENNYISGVRTKGNAHRGGIVIMSSESEGLLEVFKHWRVRDIVVRNNTIIDCQQSFVYGGGNYGVAPFSAALERNLVARPLGAIVRAITPLLHPAYKNEHYHGGPPGIAPAPGIDTTTDPRLTAKIINGYTLWFPAGDSGLANTGAQAGALKPLREIDVGPCHKNQSPAGSF